MVAAAGAGILRAIRNGRGLAMGALLVVDGVSLVLAALFSPDPVNGFPPGSRGGDLTLSGTLHLLFGAIGFAAIAAAAFAHAAWNRSIGARRAATPSVALGIVVAAGFIGGAALSSRPAGIALLWLAVLVGWGWLAYACAQIYGWSPHPLRSLRPQDAPRSTDRLSGA